MESQVGWIWDTFFSFCQKHWTYATWFGMRHGTNSAVFLYIVQKAYDTPHSDVDAKIRDPFIQHILELHNKYAVSFHCGGFVS